MLHSTLNRHYRVAAAMDPLWDCHSYSGASGSGRPMSLSGRSCCSYRSEALEVEALRQEIGRLWVAVGSANGAAASSASSVAPSPAAAMPGGGGSCCSASAPTAGARALSGSDVELLREIERLDVALVAERQKVAELSEEKRASEEAHARDVAALENMLQQASDENAQLRAQVAKLQSGVASDAGRGTDVGRAEAEASQLPCGADGVELPAAVQLPAATAVVADGGADPSRPAKAVAKVAPAGSAASDMEEPEMEPRRRDRSCTKSEAAR